MKPEDLTPMKPRPMGKAELAMLYAPELTISAAVKRLMQWIHHNPRLTEALNATGYRTMQKILTARQVAIIFEYLGEP